MMNEEERLIALAEMNKAINDFYYRAVRIGNHPFIEFAGVMTAYAKSCARAHETGIDFSECNKHTGHELPIEPFEIKYLNEKLDCIFGGRINAYDPEQQKDYERLAIENQRLRELLKSNQAA